MVLGKTIGETVAREACAKVVYWSEEDKLRAKRGKACPNEDWWRGLKWGTIFWRRLCLYQYFMDVGIVYSIDHSMLYRMSPLRDACVLNIHSVTADDGG